MRHMSLPLPRNSLIGSASEEKENNSLINEARLNEARSSQYSSINEQLTTSNKPTTKQDTNTHTDQKSKELSDMFLRNGQDNAKMMEKGFNNGQEILNFLCPHYKFDVNNYDNFTKTYQRYITEERKQDGSIQLTIKPIPLPKEAKILNEDKDTENFYTKKAQEIKNSTSDTRDVNIIKEELITTRSKIHDEVKNLLQKGANLSYSCGNNTIKLYVEPSLASQLSTNPERKSSSSSLRNIDLKNTESETSPQQSKGIKAEKIKNINTKLPNQHPEINSIVTSLDSWQKVGNLQGTFGFELSNRADQVKMQNLHKRLNELLIKIPKDELMQSLTDNSALKKEPNFLILSYNDMNILQKASFLRNQLLSADVQTLNEFKSIISYDNSGIRMAPYAFVGLDSEVPREFLLYRQLEQNTDRILYRVSKNNSQQVNQFISKILTEKIEKSKTSELPSVIAIQASDGTYTEPYIFKISDGKITNLLLSDSSHKHRFIDKKFIPTDSKNIKTAFYVRHDGACTKYSDHALNTFVLEMQAQKNNAVSAFDSIFSNSHTSPIKVNIEQELLLANFGYDARIGFTKFPEKIDPGVKYSSK